MKNNIGLKAGFGLALVLLIFGVVFWGGQKPKQQSQIINIYAASSLTQALTEAANQYQNQTGQKIVLTYAASSTLARQIEQGANADIFISADVKWADYLSQKKLLNEESKINFLGGKLVLVSSNLNEKPLSELNSKVLNNLISNDKISLAETQSVPAGIYARQALGNLKLWGALKNKIIQSENVKTALIYVARGQVPLGIVYETDAMAENRVKIIYYFPENSHDEITYPMALTKSANPEASRFYHYLLSPDGKAIFNSHGFIIRNSNVKPAGN